MDNTVLRIINFGSSHRNKEQTVINQEMYSKTSIRLKTDAERFQPAERWHADLTQSKPQKWPKFAWDSLCLH